MRSIYLFFVIALFLLFVPKFLPSSNIKTSVINVFKYIALIFAISAFFGIRNTNIGLDSVRYLGWFREGSNSYIMQLKGQAEKGFEVLILCLHTLMYMPNSYISDKLFLFSMSFLIVLGNFIFYYKLDRKNCCTYLVLMSCFYYFYIFHLSMYRQAIAIGIVDISYLEFRHKCFIRYFLLGMLAFSIHYSALIFLLFPVINFFSQRIHKRCQHFIFFILLVFFLKTSIIKTIVSLIPDFSHGIAVLKSYILYQNLGSVHISHSHLITMFIIFLTNVFFKVVQKNDFFDVFMFHTVYFVFIALFQSSVVVYDRFYFYVQLFEPFIIFHFYSVVKEKKLAKYMICFFVLTYSIFTIFIWGPRNLIQPYYL